MREEKAIAILMANLKGARKKNIDLVEFAEACRIIKEKWNGFKPMSDFFKVSVYQLRQIDKINELDENTKNMIKEKRLGIEASYQLWRLDKNQRSDALKLFKNMTTDEIRTFIHFLKSNPHQSVAECKREFDKVRNKQIQLLVIPLEPEIHKELKYRAEKSKISIHDYVLKLIEKSLN